MLLRNLTESIDLPRNFMGTSGSRWENQGDVGILWELMFPRDQKYGGKFLERWLPGNPEYSHEVLGKNLGKVPPPGSFRFN
jgi:hypothetical protein